MCQHADLPQWALTLTLSHPDWPEPWAATVEVCDDCLLLVVARMDARETPPAVPEPPRRTPVTHRARESYQARRIREEDAKRRGG